MFKSKNNLIFIALLTLTALFLRFYRLSDFPVSLNWDEVSHGYNAYSLLQTGKDEWGNFLPLIFRAFGDYKLPVYIYLTIFPVLIFGLNAFAVRFVSALAGTLAIPGIYLLTNSLFPDKNITICKLRLNLGHLSALVLTFMPWHFFISRPALEANLSLTLIIFGFFFLHRGLKDRKSLIFSSLLLGLSLHTYNTARVFVPALLLVFIFLFRKQIKFSGSSNNSENNVIPAQAGIYANFRLNKVMIVSSVLFLSFFALVLYQVVSGTGTARYSKLKILTDNAVYRIGQSRLSSKLPQPLPVLIHNRPVYFATTVLSNYLGYFSPKFLYQWQGAQTQFAIPIKNLLSLPVTILGIVGLVYLLIKRNRSGSFILFWLLLSPLAASLTADPPQALRPNPFIPSIAILAGLGIYLLVEKSRLLFKTVVLASVTVSLILSLHFYLVDYYGDYAHYYSDSWQYGYKQVFEFLNHNDLQYDKVIFTKKYGEPHIFYAFYNKLNPSILQPGGDSIRFNKSDWFWTDKIGDYYFVNDWDIPYRGETINSLKLESGEIIDSHRSLLVTTFNRVPDNAKVEKIIEFVDGRVAFIIASVP